MGLPLRQVERMPTDYPELTVKPTPSVNTQIIAMGSTEAERRDTSPTQPEFQKLEKANMSYENSNGKLKQAEIMSIEFPELTEKPALSVSTQNSSIESAEAETRNTSSFQSENGQNKMLEKANVICDTSKTTSNGKLKSLIVRNEDETITVADFQNKQISNGQRITQV